MVMTEAETRAMCRRLLAVSVAKLHNEMSERIMHGSPDVIYKGIASEGIGG